MAEKESDKQTPEKKKAAKSGGAKVTAAKKPAAKKAAEKKPETPPKEEIEDVLGGEAAAAAAPEPETGPAEEKDDEPSEEEFRRLVEESLETVTVADIVLTMMNQLASVGYMKMGMPESVNLKYRDFTQARLAIDTLEAMIKGAEAKIPEDFLRPFKGTLANLQMNFFQLNRGQA